jgi:hypothetical protein
VTEESITLDERRGMMAQRATDIRRRLAHVEVDRVALQQRRGDLEKFLLTAPGTTWGEAAEKARYLITLLAGTRAGRDPRRQKLIEAVLNDFRRLSDGPTKQA